MEKMRAFIAIELPAETRQALTGLEAELKAAGGAPARWVDPVNIHLTLKFLGDIDSDATGRIMAALQTASGGTHPFTVAVSGLGVFPNPKRVQIIWVGLTGELDKLNRLQKRIEEELVPLGFPAEGRAFTPHLTLARVRDYAGPDARQKLGQLIEKTGFEAKSQISVNAVHLIKSQLTREGPIYTKISTIELK
ncbi:MAG: RNA 2',3'-cyclic phosphodiesterase [Dehalococcoidales bacterium]|jgi:2'-5' RNA ligase